MYPISDKNNLSKPESALLDFEQRIYNQVQKFNSFDTTNKVVDGYWGIATEYKNMNMRINEISKDNQGNIWVTNPYCERYGHLLAIQSSVDNSWSHINIPDSNSFRPVTIDFDRSNRAWIGFVYDVLNDGELYSNGGVKVYNTNDSSWVSISNLEDLPGIGPTKALNIVKEAGISGNPRVKDLTESDLNLIRDIVDKDKIEGDLRQEVNLNIRRLIDIVYYIGVRHIRGLPVRGQRTSTNARTKRGRRQAIAGKNIVRK